LDLYDFSQPAQVALFHAIDDVVMGGRSHSRLAHDPRGFAVFEGVLSLEDGGGFASVRSEPRPRDLSAHGGLVLRVRGDGRRYKLNLRADGAFDGVTWQAAFQPPAGDWTEVALPFAAFAPTFRGRPVAAGPLDAASVATLGFLVARDSGNFRLELSWIRAA
jgi:NADH dehydrogenase [ubiquinone] 1 alpha subcomplex assembly factor 1